LNLNLTWLKQYEPVVAIQIDLHLICFSDKLGDTVLANRQFIIFLATLLVTLPLSLYRDIAKLGKVSYTCKNIADT